MNPNRVAPEEGGPMSGAGDDSTPPRHTSASFDGDADARESSAWGDPERQTGSRNVKTWDYFVSHAQGTGGSQASALVAHLENRALRAGAREPLRAWLDVRMPDRSESGMREGVRGSSVYMLFLTRDVFYRDDECEQPRKYVIMEAEEALKHDKPMVLVHEVDKRHGGCEFEELIQRTPPHLRERLYKIDAVPYLVSSEYHLQATLDEILDRLAPHIDPSHPLSAGSKASRLINGGGSGVDGSGDVSMWQATGSGSYQYPVGPHIAIGNDDMQEFWRMHFPREEKTASDIFFNSLMRHVRLKFNIDAVDELKVTQARLIPRIDRNKDGKIHASEVDDSFPIGVDVLEQLQELVRLKGILIQLPHDEENIVGRASATEDILAALTPQSTSKNDSDSDVEAGRASPVATSPATLEEGGTSLKAATSDSTMRKKAAPRVVVVLGSAGSGKSTIAVHACYRLASKMDEVGILFVMVKGGVWFVDLRKMTEVRKVIERIASVMGCHMSDGEPFTLFKHINDLVLDHVTILLDNAEDTVLQCKTEFFGMCKKLLQECPSVRLLFTTRVSIVLAAVKAKTVRLGPMDPDEAEELLRERSDVETKEELESLPTLASLCGYLPTALRVAASIISQGVKTATELVQDIQNGEDEGWVIDELSGEGVEGGVEDCMRSAIDSLTDEMRNTLLSIADGLVGSFDIAAAKSMFGRTAKKILNALCDRSLLEYNKIEQRYVVHTLVRAYALKLIAEGEELPTSPRGPEPVCENFSGVAPPTATSFAAVREDSSAEAARETAKKRKMNPGRVAFIVHFSSMLRRVGQLYDEGFETASLHMFDRDRHNFDELFEIIMSGSLHGVVVEDSVSVDLAPELARGSKRLPPLEATSAVVQALGSWGVLGVLRCRIPALVEDLLKAAETSGAASAQVDDTAAGLHKPLALLALQSADHFAAEKADEDAIKERVQAAHDRVAAHFDRDSREYLESTLSLQAIMLDSSAFSNNVQDGVCCYPFIGETGHPINRKSRRLSMCYDKRGPRDAAVCASTLFCVCCCLPPDNCSGEPCKSTLPLIPEWERAHDEWIRACDLALNSDAFPLPSKIRIRQQSIFKRFSAFQLHFEALQEARTVYAAAKRVLGRDHLVTLDVADELKKCLERRGRRFAASQIPSRLEVIREKLGTAHPGYADALLGHVIAHIAQRETSGTILIRMFNPLRFFEVRRQIGEAIDIYKNAVVDDARLAKAYKAKAICWDRYGLVMIGLGAVYPALHWLRRSRDLYRRAGASKEYEALSKQVRIMWFLAWTLPFLAILYVWLFHLIISDVFCWMPDWLIWIGAFMLPMTMWAFAFIAAVILVLIIGPVTTCFVMDTRTLRDEVPEFFEDEEGDEDQKHDKNVGDADEGNKSSRKNISSRRRNRQGEGFLKFSVICIYGLACAVFLFFMYRFHTWDGGNECDSHNNR